jgi:hypothetical protein
MHINYTAQGKIKTTYGFDLNVYLIILAIYLVSINKVLHIFLQIKILVL